MYHSLTVEEVLRKLKTSRDGLTQKEAKRRLKEYGYNEITKRKRISILKLLLAQILDVFVLLLIFAIVISLFFGEVTDAIAIAAIVVLNVTIGFFQEHKAEKALEALKRYLSPKARVIRDGKTLLIDARYLVPGDVVLLEEGDRVPADGRLIEAYELKVDESLLTGESTPVSKFVKKLPIDVGIPERKNMVFAGTYVVRGRALFVVTATGAATEIGKIAKLTEEIKEEAPPLKKKLARFAKKIAYLIAVIILVIFLAEVVRAIQTGGLTVSNLIKFFMVSIALAVSAVPEGLPAVVTITLSLGAKEMVKRNALIRKLASVETLGSVDVICVDKTGTITKGEMTVKKIYVDGKTIEVTGVGYTPEGKFLHRGKEHRGKDLELLLLAGALANNAKLILDTKWKIFGDPTEGALIVAAKKYGIRYDYKRLKEYPFSSERRMMSTINLVNGKKMMFTKGAVEVILEKCNRILKDGKVVKLKDVDKKKIMRMNNRFARQALRVLAIAYKEAKDEEEKNFVFLGLVGMLDPPRPEVKEALKKCEKAGIKTIMITGDHKLTAVAIAKEVGIWKGGKVLTGDELARLSEEELEKMIDDVEVFARVLPIQKLKIVKALKKRNHIVAMTGDGVNDAPALKQADIGIAVGSGTDVAKEASDMILLDDNYATIVAAVEKGRQIYDNIRKFAFFLMRSNFDEIAVVGTFGVLGFPLPFTPAMILWQNLITDGPPALSLAVDPELDDVMNKPPRPPQEGILHGRGLQILVSFISQYLSTTLVFFFAWAAFGSITVARTMAFVQSCTRELVIVWNCRSEKKGIFRLNPLTNKYLLASVVISLVLLTFVVQTPMLAVYLGATPLNLKQWLISMAVAWSGALIMPELFYGKRILKLKRK